MEKNVAPFEGSNDTLTQMRLDNGVNSTLRRAESSRFQGCRSQIYGVHLLIRPLTWKT